MNVHRNGTFAWRLGAYLFGLFAALLCLFPSGLLAQSPVTGEALVRGSLNRPYSRHILTLSAWDPAKPIVILLEYSPQGRWELDDNSGFFVFDQIGYDRFRSGEIPGAVSVGAGDRLPGEGRRLQATIGAPVPGTFHVIVYNDSSVPMGYTLRATNGGFSDSGGQVIAGSAPGPAGGGSEVYPLVIVPGPTPVPRPSSTPLPPLRASVVRGLLDERYAQDFFILDVVDTGLPLTIEMVYDPAEQILLLDSFNFWLFDEDQFRTQAISGSRPEFEPNRAAGRLIEREGAPPLWTATIENPLDRYWLVVNQHQHALSVGYRLTVQNGVLVDEGQQAQAVTLVPRRLPGQGSTLWVVRPGETLGTIAQAVYGNRGYYAAICAANGLANCNRLYSGQRLILPSATSLPSIAPPSRPVQSSPTSAGGVPVSGAPVADNLLEVAEGQASLQTFRDLLGQTSLADTLRSAGAYTLFAFTNDAFDALPLETQDELLLEPARALSLLSGQVAKGRLGPDWVSTRTKHITTLDNGLLRLDPDGADGFTVNGFSVSAGPIEAANGVIYVVDGVLE